MNALINTNKPYKNYPDKKDEHLEKRTLGDIFAVSVLGLYTVAAIVVSSWSAYVLFIKHTFEGSPIGLLFNMMTTIS